MGLFNKIHNKVFVASSGIIFCFTLFYLYARQPDQPDSVNDRSSISLIQTLQQADSSISASPAIAEQLAKKALALSIAQHNFQYTTRSWIVLAKLAHLNGHHHKALSFYSKATTLARKNNFVPEECEALLQTGEIIYEKGDYDLALKWFQKADSFATKNNLENKKAYALYYIGKYHQTKGLFNQAKDYYLKSIMISRKNKDDRLLALILPSLGKNYISEGNLYVALTCYQEAFYISNEIHDQLLSADICNHLGSLYLQLKEYDKAMYYHRQALHYRVNMNFPDGLAKSYNNIGKLFLETNRLDSAGFYFNKSLLLCHQINYKKGTVKALINLGKVAMLTNQWPQATAYLSESFHIAKSAGYDTGISEASLDLGNLYKDSHQPDTAIFYYTIALNKLLKTNYDETLLKTYQGLFECYQIKKDYKKALEYHEAILKTEMRLLDVENKRQLALLNLTFETERKEKDYQVLLKDNELKELLLKRKNGIIWFTIVALCLTIVLCAAIYNRFYSKKKANQLLENLNFKITNQNKELEKLNKELERVNMEKDKLFSIIAHELRNPLYWLQNLAEVLSQKYQMMAPDKIKKSLLSLDESAKNVYHLMDNLLQWSRSKLNRVHPRKANYRLHTLVSETAQTYETFLQQKEITFLNNLSEDIMIYADSDLLTCVVRNLISNAIKYTSNGGKIQFDYELKEKCVVLIMSDSGKGMASSELRAIFSSDSDTISTPGLMQEKGSGIGLKLCKEFIEMNDGSIWAESTQDVGTKFFFTVPLSPLHLHQLGQKEFGELIM
jgi:signal transduction histidine kinase